MSDPRALILVALAGLFGGAVNAIAGGGSLLSFPALIAAGLPPLTANVTNTVAMLPGYVGAALAQRDLLQGQRTRLASLLPLAALGGLVGGLLLLAGDARLFARLVPWLLLVGSLLLAIQDPLGAWLRRRIRGGSGRGRSSGLLLAAPAVLLAAVYGGYFGAGLGVIVMAALALTLEDSLTRLNGLKQTISLAANLAPALLFLIASPLERSAALVLALGALVGGAIGGRLASRLDPARLRLAVVLIGLVMAVVYFGR